MNETSEERTQGGGRVAVDKGVQAAKRRARCPPVFTLAQRRRYGRVLVHGGVHVDEAAQFAAIPKSTLRYQVRDLIDSQSFERVQQREREHKMLVVNRLRMHLQQLQVRLVELDSLWREREPLDSRHHGQEDSVAHDMN